MYMYIKYTACREHLTHFRFPVQVTLMSNGAKRVACLVDAFTSVRDVIVGKFLN